MVIKEKSDFLTFQEVCLSNCLIGAVKDPDTGIAEIVVAKNRHGQTGVSHLLFQDTTPFSH
ncbi:MAG: hypothetical protein JRD05_12695 [Deltaproteobacteria bacterium]|nr:hypothetical protein [Deltaproteobacteria bacterium]